MRIVEYREFLQLPEIKEAFEERYARRKKYFRDKFQEQNGFDNEHLEIACMKMSLIDTDLYFTEIHRDKYKNNH